MNLECDVVANIKYRAWLSDENGSRRHVQVRLESLCDIAPRKGQVTNSSPSVTAYLAPQIHVGQQDAAQSKASTMIYKDSPEFVLFDWKKNKKCAADRSEFSFEVADRHVFLCLEMFDHSALKTHKYFRGAVYVLLAELGKEAGVTLESPLKKLPALGRNFILF